MQFGFMKKDEETGESISWNLDWNGNLVEQNT
jgi:hypothetical protein